MQSFQEYTHLKDYLQVIRRYRKAAVLFFVSIVAIVTAGSFIVKPVYRATSTILIDLESPNMLTTTGSVALGPQNYYTYKEYYQSQKEIIKSRSIASAVFDEYKLIEEPEYAKAKEPLERFLKTITVESVRDTRLVKLHVDNKDPILAASIANKIAGLYVRQNLRYITKGEYLNLLKNEYLKLQSRLSEESKIYKEKHPIMVRLKERISQMAARIEAEKQNITMSLSEKRLAGSSNADFVDVTLDGLKANNIRVMDPAQVPVVPLWPKKELNITVAIFLGFFGGIGLTFFTEYLDTTVKGEKDIERHVKMPFLGTVPRIGSDKDTRQFRKAEKDIVCHLRPNSIVSEAYRSIRTSILFASSGEKAVKDIIITSPGPREGKTTTACNLAIAFANLGHRVLLVDADLRKPRLHEVFNFKNTDGLGAILKDKRDVRVTLDRVINKTEIDNLFVILSGADTSSPSETLGSVRMREFIENAGKKFDFILIDTPPINVVTDAAVLTRFVGGVITVVEGGKTMKNILSRTERLLQNVKAQIIGVIVNNITHEDGESAYYLPYYYSETKKNT